MEASRELKQAVKFKLGQWGKESALHFCRLAQAGATFTNVVYPTGYKAVIAEMNGERAEVALHVAKQLRSAGFKVVA